MTTVFQEISFLMYVQTALLIGVGIVLLLIRGELRKLNGDTPERRTYDSMTPFGRDPGPPVHEEKTPSR